QDAIPFGPAIAMAAIVLDIADPHSATMIDIEIGRIGDLWLGDEERRLKLRMNVKVLDGVGGIVNGIILARLRRLLLLSREVDGDESAKRQDEREDGKPAFHGVKPPEEERV